jgi:hypothetical protein
MASNDNGKRKLEEEVESSMARKRLRLSDVDADDDNSSDSSEEVSLEETSMKQLDTSEELFTKRGCGMIFSDDGNTTSPSLEPCTPESRWRSDEDNIDDDDDFWM